MVSPARKVLVASTTADSGPYSFTKGNAVVGTPLPSTPLLESRLISQNQDIVAMASDGTYRYAGDGDVMLGITLNGLPHRNDEALWTVNDMFVGAETQAPLYAHAYFRQPSGRSQVSLDATEFPWMGREDTVSCPARRSSR
jgi:hypothetical protein